VPKTQNKKTLPVLTASDFNEKWNYVTEKQKTCMWFSHGTLAKQKKEIALEQTWTRLSFLNT